MTGDPWETKDFRRPAQGAPNQLSKSSLSNPDLFYADTEYSVQKMPGPNARATNSGTGTGTGAEEDKSKIPYQRFKQTLQDYSRQKQAEGQQALEQEKSKQSFLGAKLPEDPGTVPGIPRSQQTQPGTQNPGLRGVDVVSFEDKDAKADVIKAALLVPLTGEHAFIGKSMLKAAETAMFNLGASGYEILPRDTMGTEQGARRAMKAAIEDGADVVMGPLFAHSTKAVKSLARRHDVKVFSFTTDWTVADKNTFTMGFLPFSQVHKIVEHAAMSGLNKIGVLAPDTEYGRAVIQAYQARATDVGIETVSIVRFPVTSSNISPIIREFTKYDERVEKLGEILSPLKEQLELEPDNEELEKKISELEAQETAGEMPYDAVILPIGGEQAKAVANLLSFYNLDPDDVVRLGTGLWDDPALATEPNLEGGRFAASSPKARVSFENQYERLYDVSPPRLATLAYDATALTVVLGRYGLQRGYSDTDLYNTRDITNPNGFAGVDGIFRFRPNGLIERGLAILTFEDRDIKILEQAPDSFEQVDRF